MNILTILISLLALIFSAFSLYYSYRSFATSKKFYGDKDMKENILSRIDGYYEETKTAIAQNKQINDFLDKILEENKRNLSTIISHKFNPYEDAGGDLSFCIVMINRELNGVMLTSLHGREQTRIYTRNIINGQSSVELMFDEKEALKEALDKLKVKN